MQFLKAILAFRSLCCCFSGIHLLSCIDEVYAHEMHARDMHAHEIHAYEMHAGEVHAYHAREMHACEVHAYEGFCEDLARQNVVAQLSQFQLRFRRRHIWVSVTAVVS
jgi:hypothetical protein